MAKSKKPRKAYRPPACRVQQYVKGCFALDRTVARVRPYTDERKAEIAIARRTELQRIATGKGTVADLDQIAIAYSVTVVMAEQIGQECIDVCTAAAAAIVAAKARYRRTHRIGFDGEGLQRVRALLDLHEELLEHITPAHYESAAREVMRRISAGDVFEEAES